MRERDRLMTKKTKAPKQNVKKRDGKEKGSKEKKFYVIIKGKRHYISPDLLEKYHFKEGEKIPFSNLKILQEK